MGFWIADLGFGSKLRISVFGLRAWVSRSQISDFGFRVSGFGFGISGFGFRVSGFGFRVSGFGFQDSGLGVGSPLEEPSRHNVHCWQVLFRKYGLRGYLAHKKQPSPLGPP